MIEREYIVSLVAGIDYDRFWDQMESNTFGTVPIPDRIVDIVNERPGSLRSCHYSLTDAEADELRRDARVYSVEIPPDQRSDIQLQPKILQESNFTKTNSDSGSFVNWGLRRCIEQSNIYGTGTLVSGPYRYTLDGTGVDVVVSDSGLQIDHPEFTSSNGISRVVQIDWYQASGLSGTQSPNFYRDFDGHGTHCAGIATGKTYGWAKGAAVYSMKVNGLEGSGDAGTGISVTDCFDTIKLWHQNKPIDPITGSKRPTIVTMSWGYVSSFSNITGGVYRGTPWSGTLPRTDYGMIGSGGYYGTRVGSVDVDIQEMISAGIVVVVAAGNYYQKIDVTGGLDYDNYFTSSLFGTRYYNRGSSPYSTDALIVGAIDSTVFNATTEYKSVFSESGPGVDIYAPGSNIMSSTSNTNKWGSGSQTYYLNPSFKQTNISGTSMACPQVAGLGALFMQINPHATPAQLKSWLLSQSKSVIYSTGLDNDYTNSRSIKGGTNRFMFNLFNAANPIKFNSAVQLKNINIIS
jgi:subtilisin family serine protease